MKSWLENNKFFVGIFFVFILGFLVRIYFVDKVVVGDLMNYAEWGQVLATRGPQNYYFSEGWYYSIPVYPPLSIWTFSAAFWLNEHKYVLAQLHNFIKLPPAAFIVYFYKWGYIFLLKLPGILADLGLAFIIFKLIFKLTKNRTKAIWGSVFYLFNPITIFISGAWGQTDSVVALFGMVSFLLLLENKMTLSLPVLFLSLYFKPSWAIFGPFYLYLIYLLRPSFRQIVGGIIFSFLLFVLLTAPFSDGNVISYGWKLFKERYPLPIGIDGKASISAFNFHTIFWRIDVDYSHEKLLFLKSSNWGIIFYLFVNLFAMNFVRKSKDKLYGTLVGLYSVGMGSFLFMATMLERYFFPGFAPLIILTFIRPKIVFQSVAINFILITNIVYSFYRRGSDELYHFFIDRNYVAMRILSLVQVLLYLNTLKVLQSKRG